jgi:hypothetical protein
MNWKARQNNKSKLKEETMKGETTTTIEKNGKRGNEQKCGHRNEPNDNAENDTQRRKAFEHETVSVLREKGHGQRTRLIINCRVMDLFTKLNVTCL